MIFRVLATLTLCSFIHLFHGMLFAICLPPFQAVFMYDELHVDAPHWCFCSWIIFTAILFFHKDQLTSSADPGTCSLTAITLHNILCYNALQPWESKFYSDIFPCFYNTYFINQKEKCWMQQMLEAKLAHRLQKWYCPSLWAGFIGAMWTSHPEQLMQICWKTSIY